MNNFINLLDYRSDKHSSTGNDGIIGYIIKKLNIKKGIFVEFGAYDGIKKSNCRKLFEEGWSGIFIESDKRRYRKLEKNYKDCENIKCINKKVEHKGNNIFDNIVDPYLKGENIDFCSIDIDGLDVEVFETFKKYLPTVVCIESGQTTYPFHKKIPKRISKKRIHQSLKATVNVFEKKGYKILCSYQDCFFVKKEFYHLFNVSSDLLTLYFDGLRAIPRRMPMIQKLMSGARLKNNIVDYILSISNYNGYERNGKRWIKEQKDLIFKSINEIEKIERKKYAKY